jgi:hypothetical protein
VILFGDELSGVIERLQKERMSLYTAGPGKAE